MLHYFTFFLGYDIMKKNLNPMEKEHDSVLRTIFLSHSSKDIEKVRKIRDILEAMEYEPLLFHMKCLDDNNDQLEDFIQKEIDARNIFVYCKSENAEASVWVQKELAYIKESSGKRLYEINIEKPLSETLVTFLLKLAEIVKNNKVFISCSHKDKILSDIVTHYLEKGGYEVIRYTSFHVNEYEKHENDILSIAENGIFLPIITNNFINSVYCMSEVEKVLYCAENSEVIFKPVYSGLLRSVAQLHMPTAARRYEMYNLGNVECMSADDMKQLLRFIETDNRL